MALFELGAVFLPTPDSETGVGEQLNLALVMTGQRPAASNEEATPFDSFDVKEAVLQALALLDAGATCENHAGRHPQLHPGVGAEVLVRDHRLGILGQLHPKVGQAYGLEAPVFLAEICIGDWFQRPSATIQFQPISRFPAATRDLALVMDENRAHGEVVKAVAQFSSALIESVELSSIYRGEPIPAGKKSVALAVIYRSQTGSLTDRKVDSLHQRLADHLYSAMDAEPR